jgi:D-3-phosphoglycerate dehydrogenase
LDECQRRGIKVLSLRDCGDLSDIPATAEHTVGLILALTRKIPLATRQATRGVWHFPRTQLRGVDLCGKTALVIGPGRIGLKVGVVLNALGMHVLYNGVRGPLHGYRAEGVEEADLVTLHVPLNDQTRGMFGGDQFAVMKRGAFFVNTSRGAVVDEAALLKALRYGHLGGAALDVLAQEPPVSGTSAELMDYATNAPDRLVLTPHIGGNTLESKAKAEALLRARLEEEIAHDQRRN